MLQTIETRWTDINMDGYTCREASVQWDIKHHHNYLQKLLCAR